MVEESDYKPITYETEWLSDEEGDVKELAELLQDEVFVISYLFYH